VCLLVLLLIHGRHIPRRLTIPAINPRTMLCDTPGAFFGTVNVLGCLGLLAAAPTLNWPLWTVTLVCAGLHMSYNFVAYVVLQKGVPAALEARRSRSSSAEAGDSSLRKPKSCSSQVSTCVVTCCLLSDGVTDPLLVTRPLVSCVSSDLLYVQHGMSVPPWYMVTRCVVLWARQHTTLGVWGLWPLPTCVAAQRPHVDSNTLEGCVNACLLFLMQWACELAVEPCSGQAAEQAAAAAASEQSPSDHHAVLVIADPSSSGVGSNQPTADSSSTSLCTYGLQQQGGAQLEGCCEVPWQEQQQQKQQGQAAPGLTTAAAAGVRSKDPSGAGPRRTSSDAVRSERDCSKAGQAAAAGAAAASCGPGAANPAPCCEASSQQQQQQQQQQQEQAPSAVAAAEAAVSRGSCNAETGQAPDLQGTLTVQRPSFWRGLWQQPWEVVPFVLGMFVMVEGLAATGWLELAGRGLAAASRGSLGAALFSVGGVSLLLGNLMNNQPMTILMTRVLLSGAYEEGVPDARVRQGAAFALVVASNLAANFTLLGSLAGIMWVTILRRQGLPGFGYLQFLRLMAPVGVACSVATLLVLWAELAGFP
jgi:hypothetical protein